MPRLLYAQVREDPEVDAEALGVTPADRLLAVTSGGCTALRLLSEGPQELLCVDSNPAQNHLLELKLAAIRSLPLAEGRRFLGARKGEGRRPVYRRLRDQLSPAACRFWDRRPLQIEEGVLAAGVTERMSGWMRRLVLGFAHPPGRLRPLLRQKGLDSQARFYRETWNNRRWRAILRFCFHPLLFRAVYGKRFFQRLAGADPAALWAAKINRGFTEIPIRSNFFLSQLFWGRFLPWEEGLPPYLRAGLYERVAANAGRLRWVCSDLFDLLGQVPPGRFTKMALSNALEWFPPDRIGPAYERVARALAPGGRLILRHLIGQTPLPAGAALRELSELSDRLTRSERAFLYSRVSVYQKPPSDG